MPKRKADVYCGSNADTRGHDQGQGDGANAGGRIRIKPSTVSAKKNTEADAAADTGAKSAFKETKGPCHKPKKRRTKPVSSKVYDPVIDRAIKLNAASNLHKGINTVTTRIVKPTDADPPRLRAAFLQAHTLQSGGVYVGTSLLCGPTTKVTATETPKGTTNALATKTDAKESPNSASEQVVAGQPMLGLFAGREFQAGDVITQYCALIKDDPKHCVRAYTARICGSMWHSDGSTFAECFNRETYPLPGQPTTLWKNGADAATIREIQTTGVGYMANNPDVHGHTNARRSQYRADRGGLLPDVVFLVATKPIRAGEEILTRYNQSMPTY